MASKLVNDHLSKIVAETENYHLLKRPGDVVIIKGFADGFYSAINNKINEEKDGNKNDNLYK